MVAIIGKILGAGGGALLAKMQLDESAVIERVPVEPLKPISRLTASLEIKQPQGK